jgi:CHASE3 domain sensor protein
MTDDSAVLRAIHRLEYALVAVVMMVGAVGGYFLTQINQTIDSHRSDGHSWRVEAKVEELKEQVSVWRREVREDYGRVQDELKALRK